MIKDIFSIKNNFNVNNIIKQITKILNSNYKRVLYEIKNKENNQIELLKIYKIINKNEKEIENIKNKLNIINNIDNLNIVKYQVNIIENEIMLIMPKYLFNLNSINIKDNNIIKETYELFNDICYGIKLFHSKHTYHGNLKPSNVLFNEKGTYKISDYISSELYGKNNILSLDDINYTSPEMLKGEEVDSKSDMWSLGCILYYLITGNPPFKSKTTYETAKSIIEYEEEKSKYDISLELSNMLPKLLCKRQKRVRILEIIDDIYSIN